jgi:hypothetical protein
MKRLELALAFTLFLSLVVVSANRPVGAGCGRVSPSDFSNKAAFLGSSPLELLL